MPYIPQVKVGTQTYNVKDSEAREQINGLNAALNIESLSGNGEINNDIVNLLEWQNGSVDSSGVPTESSIRIRSNMFSTLAYDAVIATPASGYKVALEEYDLHGIYLGEDAFSTGARKLEPERQYIIIVGKTDNSNISPSEASNISVMTTNSGGNKSSINNSTIKEILNTIDNNFLYHPIDYSLFEIGELYNDSGTPDISHAKRQRVSTTWPIALKKNTRIGLTDYTDYAFYVAYGTEGAYTFTSTLTSEFILPMDANCYICVSKKSNETDIYNVIDYVNKLIIKNPAEDIDFNKYDSNTIIKTIEPGSINIQGAEVDASTDIRRRTKMAFAKKGSVLCVPNDFAEFYFEVMLYGDTITGSGWAREYYFESDSYFRLICRKTDNSAWTANDEAKYSQTVRFVNAPVNLYKNRTGENIRSICHAGLEGAPENTLPAFIEGFEAGFTIMECDSRITKDGIFVLLHDATINRTGRNLDGSTISQTINVNDLTYDELLNYDFGIWKGEKYRGTKIPTTQEALELFRDLGVGVYVDIATYPYFTKEQIWSLMELVDNAGMHDRATYIVQSGYASYIIEKDDTANFAVLGANAANWILAASCLTGKNAVSLDAQYDTITQTKIDNARQHGVPMEAWTVTDQDSQDVVDEFHYLTGITGTINPAQKYYREKALNAFNQT